MSESTARILIYSDDRTLREQVRLALGKRVAADLPELEIVETATQPATLQQIDSGEIDMAILDGEAVPSGGMGLAHQLKDEVPECPPILLLVIRLADAWLGTWSRADAIAVQPIDPITLPQQVAALLRARLAEDAEDAEADEAGEPDEDSTDAEESSAELQGADA
jgi:DNA-binding response OmpR family regulator